MARRERQTLRHCHLSRQGDTARFSRLSELCRHSAHTARHVTGVSVEILSLHSTLSVVLLKIILFWRGVRVSLVCKVFGEQV